MLPPRAGDLRIVLVEDEAADVDLILRALRGLAWPVRSQRARSADELLRALASFAPEIVLSDFSMPGFSGFEALQIVNRDNRDIPFIFVSGTIGEERAIEALQRGASDYVLKDNLNRLVPSIERALATTEERRQRRRAERALLASEERFRSIVETTEDWIWETDAAGRFTYSNHSISRILGFAPHEILGSDGAQLWPPEDAQDVSFVRGPHRAQRSHWAALPVNARHRDGSTRYLESTGHPLFDDASGLVGYRGIDRDVTRRVAQDAKLGQLSRLRAVLSALGSSLMASRDRGAMLDTVCRVAIEHGEFASAVIIEGVAGAPPYPVAQHHGDPALFGRVCAFMVDPAHDRVGPVHEAVATGRIVHVREIGALRGALDPGTPPALTADRRSAIALPFGDGPSGVLLLHCRQTHTFDDDEVALLERLAADINHALAFIATTQRLAFLAHHHPSTGLPNREKFQDVLRQRLEAAAAPVVVALLSPTEFYRLQDTREHGFIVHLLCEVAHELRAHLPPDDLLAQLSDTTFAIAFDHRVGLEAAIARLEAAVDICSTTPCLIDGEQIHVALHCGVVLAGVDTHDASVVERQAHSALSEARRRGQRIVTYSRAFGERASRRLVLERALRHALEAHQFALYLQPKFDVRSGALVGAEALLRWPGSSHDAGPAEFVPILEETGLIVPVGRWVMQYALGLAAQWRADGHPRLRVAINVSAREFRHEHFVRHASECVAAFGPDHGLDLEITESVLMEDIELGVRSLGALRDLGCRIHIDDFGTGYSSLHYLSRLPVDGLKVDQSFVARIESDPESVALVSTTISMGHSLNLRVIAEGVETEGQARLLRLLRCDELQGYHLGRPVPVEEFALRFLRAETPGAS